MDTAWFDPVMKTGKWIACLSLEESLGPELTSSSQELAFLTKHQIDLIRPSSMFRVISVISFYLSASPIQLRFQNLERTLNPHTSLLQMQLTVPLLWPPLFFSLLLKTVVYGLPGSIRLANSDGCLNSDYGCQFHPYHSCQKWLASFHQGPDSPMLRLSSCGWKPFLSGGKTLGWSCFW